MAKVRIDRTSIFLGALGLLFVWQQASFFGVGIPDVFNLIPQFVNLPFLRGFSSTLRELIFVSVSGYILGIGIALVVLRSAGLSRAVIQFLRLGLWLPFLFFFVFPQYVGILGISAAALCACYQYLTRKLLFVGEHKPAILIQVAREVLLQTFFLILLAEIWWPNWLANWLKLYETATLSQSVAVGVGVLGVVLIFVGTVNWFCRYSFENSAAVTATVASKQLADSWTSFFGALVILIGCLLTWHILSTPMTSPAAAVDATVYLFRSGEIWSDIRMTLTEILGGLSLSVIFAVITSKVLSQSDAVRRSLSRFLPLTYLSPIILFMLWFFIFPAKEGSSVASTRIVFIGALSFYPLLRVYWGLRGESAMRRVFLGADYALPFAIVASLIGELYSTIAGLGFLMVVATATNQPDKALVGFLLVALAGIVLSSIFRGIVRLSSFGRAEAAIPAPTN